MDPHQGPVIKPPPTSFKDISVGSPSGNSTEKVVQRSSTQGSLRQPVEEKTLLPPQAAQPWDARKVWRINYWTNSPAGSTQRSHNEPGTPHSVRTPSSQRSLNRAGTAPSSQGSSRSMHRLAEEVTQIRLRNVALQKRIAALEGEPHQRRRPPVPTSVGPVHEDYTLARKVSR